MKGIIYCRVSSKEQVDGTSLESQEAACRDYAARNQIDVLRVFVERGESAKFADRTQLLELLTFCRDRKNAVQVLLVWKVDRLARNVGDHYNIKANLLKQDIRVVSVTEPIDSNPEGKLLETILAGFAQFDNDLRAARTVQGMKRKMEEGLFPWKPPLGYKTVTQHGDKKTKPDVPDQPLFQMLQRAWREFATGKYTRAEMLRLMTSWGVRTRRGMPLTPQSLDNMFRDPFYAGIIRNPWTREDHPGRHIPLISSEAFAIVQQIMLGNPSRRKPHISLRPELPLRMFARCNACERYVSGSLSRGRSQYYPYYRCFSRTCLAPGNYRAKVIHDEFLGFIQSITPQSSNIQRLIDAIGEAAKSRAGANHLIHRRRKQEQQRLERQREELIQMRMENLLTTEEFLAHQTRITRGLQELGTDSSAKPINEEQIVSVVEKIRPALTNLPAVWLNLPVSVKPRFQQSILPVGFVAGRIGTAQMSGISLTLYGLKTQKSTLVHPEGDIWNQLTQELKEFSEILRSFDVSTAA